MTKVIAILIICAALAGCTGTGTTSQTRADRFTEQLGQIVDDPATVAYLVEEAKLAGVSRFILHEAGGTSRRGNTVSVVYGQATWNTGTRQGNIELNLAVPGAASVTNITHEIAHVAAYRKGCFAHGNVWLEYLMGMAERYEARFPGKNWGQSTPTASVRAKYDRYAAERNKC